MAFKLVSIYFYEYYAILLPAVTPIKRISKILYFNLSSRLICL